MQDFSASFRHWAWIAILIVSSLAFSLVFACATPFAAFAVLAALYFNSREAIVLVLGVWLINQIVGYGLLGYPQNAESFGWGGSIGIAALVALAGAFWVDRSFNTMPSIFRWALMLVVSFGLYEVSLMAATAMLPSSADAFSWRIIGEIFLVNVLAFAGLLICEKIALAIGLATAPAAKPSLTY